MTETLSHYTDTIRDYCDTCGVPLQAAIRIDAYVSRMVGSYGHFIKLKGNSNFTFEFYRAQPAEGRLISLIPIPNHIRFNLLHKILMRDTFPRTTIEHLVFHLPKEALTGRII